MTGHHDPLLMTLSFTLAVAASAELRVALIGIAVAVAAALLAVAADRRVRRAQSEAQEHQRRAAELEKREQHFRGLIENASDLITLLDTQAQLLYVSPSIRRYGFDADELIGRNLYEFVHPDDIARVQETFAEIVRVPGSTHTVECRGRRRDGSWAVLEAIAWNALDNPAIGAIVVNSRDVTYRQQLEQRLRQAHKMDAVVRFAGGMAHDFNNLLLVLNGHLELMRLRLPPDAELLDHLEAMSGAADRATRLTAQLLAFSRKQVLQPRVFDLNTLIAELDPTLRRLAGSMIELIAETEPELWHTRADYDQIEQVLVNLIVNARDALPRCGTITIRTENVRLSARYVEFHGAPIAAGEYVRLSVSDTGVGMDEPTRAQAFDPFFTTKDRTRRAGLGLATVFGIVKQSGGHVTVESRPGAGTTFIVYLPRVGEAVTPLEPGSALEQDAAGECVLLVEDEAAVRHLVRRVLQQAGYTVLEAADGAEALSVIEDVDGQFDIVVTDVVMPVLSGPQLVQQLRQWYPDMPVIYMSGYIDETPLRGDDFAAATYFIAKPFAPVAMVHKVREALQASSRSKS